MTFTDAIKSGFQNYATFAGRAARPEFWYWVLFTVLGAIVTLMIDYAIFGDDYMQPLNTIFSLGTLLPSLAVGARRLHDIGRTGWWQLLILIIFGIFVLIYWWCQRGEPGPNRYDMPALASA